MTLDEAISLANEGNIGVMQVLGEYYLKDDNYPEAWNWFSKAADKGYTKSIVNAALVGTVVSLAGMEAVGASAAVEEWERTLMYSQKALYLSDVPQDMKQLIQEKLPMVLFYLGYCLYFTDQKDKAISYLTKDVALADPACRVVVGLCYFDKAVDLGLGQQMAQALPYLREVDRANIKEAPLNYVAYMNLALIYRSADDLKIPGVRKDDTLSRQYVLKAAQCGEGWGEYAKKELLKYRKGLFGGYTYNG